MPLAYVGQLKGQACVAIRLQFKFLRKRLMSVPASNGKYRALTQALSLISLLLSGCAPSLSVITPESQIEGRLINGTAIRIASSFTLRPALYSATYPAGLYFPQFQDEDGVYFRAERPIVVQTIAGGTTMEGGIYVLKSSWSDYQVYIEESSGIRKAEIPFDIDITIVSP